MIHDLPKGSAVDTAAAEVIVRQMQAAFAPYRCFVTLGEDQCLDFEVMTMTGDPVVALTPSPVDWFTRPGAMEALIREAKQVGRERGHAFDAP